MTELKVGIIDADLLYRSRHRFPNLACMKISGFHKERGDETELVTDYGKTGGYDKIYLSKVFTDTYVPGEILEMENLTYGGTGFYYDNAPPLPEEIEHHMPDYGLYREYVEKNMQPGKSRAYKFYTDYSIGFLSRGCFRRCAFCVNRNSLKSEAASPLEEFMDRDRKKLCFLDDNFLACRDWEPILDKVLESGKRFQFRQGLDLRIMQKRQMEKLFSGKLDGNVIFAFDDIRDRDIIVRKLELLYETVPTYHKELKLYVLCGFDRSGQWKPDFWVQDIRDTLERVRILMRYGCLAYIMCYEKCWKSPYKGMYITISRWCNQPAQYAKKSLRQFCMEQGEQYASNRYLTEFEKAYPELSEYFDMKYGEELGRF